MHIAFGIFPIGDGQPDPLHARFFCQIAIKLCVFTLFKQGDDMSASQFAEYCKINFPWTVKQSQPPIAHFDKVNGWNILHREFKTSAICNTL